MEDEFICEHCLKKVTANKEMGTAHRNHCPFCLWSKHVDLRESGDRKSACLGLMEPIGLTFKNEGYDKYGELRQGEIMIVHRCLKGDKISINRIAGDDSPEEILKVFENSLKMPSNLREELEKEGIKLLTENDLPQIKNQLFGKKD